MVGATFGCLGVVLTPGSGSGGCDVRTGAGAELEGISLVEVTSGVVTAVLISVLCKDLYALKDTVVESRVDVDSAVEAFGDVVPTLVLHARSSALFAWVDEGRIDDEPVVGGLTDVMSSLVLCERLYALSDRVFDGRIADDSLIEGVEDVASVDTGFVSRSLEVVESKIDVVSVLEDVRDVANADIEFFSRFFQVSEGKIDVDSVLEGVRDVASARIDVASRTDSVPERALTPDVYIIACTSKVETVPIGIEATEEELRAHLYPRPKLEDVNSEPPCKSADTDPLERNAGRVVAFGDDRSAGTSSG